MTEAVTTTTGNMAALYAALAAAQGEFQPIEKNRTGQDGNRKFPYADLEEIIKKTRPALVKQGLAVIQYPQRAEKGHQLVTVLAHKEGATLESVIEIPLMGEVKKFGGAITYLRRYAYQSVVCVCADEDLDGMDDDQDGAPPQQSASTVTMPQRREQPRSAPEQATARAASQKAAEQTGDPAAKLQATQGEWNWINNQIQALGITWEDAYKKAGIAFDPVEPKPVTKADFKLLKAVLSNADV